MKHLMLPRNAILRDTPSSSELHKPTSFKKPRPTRKRKSKDKENDPPFKSHLPPRPPSSTPNPLKRKIPDNSLLTTSSDSGVKVFVRVRPPCHDKVEGDSIVQKISADSLSINGQNFTFDAVAHADDTQAWISVCYIELALCVSLVISWELLHSCLILQLDMFELVGVPLVENCLAGFNSSVFAYGQTGSGKTYTMWGPANALSDENSTNDQQQQGLAPRVFERLFGCIKEEQIKHSYKQLEYQCHCSFLEIYNEQITDLLDPNQRNLQIREDVKSGVYVENLTKEQVCTVKDVTQLLVKGLLNRRVGATSINSESSRSHTVFTCVVESRCKSRADGVSRFRISKINLVDLAGSERQKLTGAAGDRLKEAGNINRSLSQLGKRKGTWEGGKLLWERKRDRNLCLAEIEFHFDRNFPSNEVVSWLTDQIYRDFDYLAPHNCLSSKLVTTLGLKLLRLAKDQRVHWGMVVSSLKREAHTPGNKEQGVREAIGEV
ncbi:hypothetical protein VNO77_01299 [Canavalia gladiata]|uniref:Kinesin-like protein n=1 Tax=Canavalia gladiata TaxID=3824 RepID=A0AAN9R655_CANGL